MEEYQNTFRDRLSTINNKGNRQWIYAKKPGGRLFLYRQIVGYSLLVLFLTGPFIKIQGEPLLFLNFVQRKFILFGQVFHPQDFHLFVLAMLIFIVFIILFTVIYGRIWCGWACPQTIFMELVFRRIEFLLEGDGPKQRRMEEKPLTLGHVARKLIKHIVFYAISFIISLYLMAYLAGKDLVLEIFKTGHMAVFIFSFVFYGIFAWLREQSCTLICPYGRLQGTLLDDNSLVVAYDYRRGEPRSIYKKNEDRMNAGKGDCVNCYNCIQVCPTGIDIRNGTQMECINCTACIDACNKVMKRFHMPKGLIRFASLKGIEEGRKFGLTPRVLLYTFVLTALLILFSSMLFLRSDIETTIDRTRVQMFHTMEEGGISNLYNMKVVNKKNKAYEIQIKLLSHKGEINHIGGPLRVEANGVTDAIFIIIIPENQITSKNMHVKLGVYADGNKIEEVYTPFVGQNR